MCRYGFSAPAGIPATRTQVRTGQHRSGPRNALWPRNTSISDPTRLRKGKCIDGGATGLKNKLISGWEVTNLLSEALMGFPADLPGNVIPLKDYR
jgi:hypothetical protein